jgi:hypothetical protein
VRIGIIVEGKTERAFKPHLYAFVKNRLQGGAMPALRFFPCDGRVYKERKLKQTVEALLRNGPTPADAVIALTDVYTGTSDFTDAADAKRKMREWVGKNDRFYPHAAQHDFEAWLLPYWESLVGLLPKDKKRKAPSGPPEQVNHGKPPSRHIAELFETGIRSYNKVRDAGKILEGQNLTVAANACPELKAFLNTILKLSGGPILE